VSGSGDISPLAGNFSVLTVQTALFGSFAAMIARRVGARIWIGRCLRIGNRACFEVNVNELRIPHTNNQAEDIRYITAAIQRHFERWIRENPDQFMWSNRRWS